MKYRQLRALLVSWLFVGLAVNAMPASAYVMLADNGASLAPVEQAQPTDTLGAPQATRADKPVQQQTHSVAAAVANNPPSAPSSMTDSNNTNAPTDSSAPNNSDQTNATNNLTADQRLAKLEQQMQNIANMNLPEQINGLRENIQQLSGQLQVQQHDIELLNKQLKSFYQDLSQQIQQIKNLNSNDSSSDNSSSDNGGTKVGADNSLQLKEADTYNSALHLLRQKQLDKAQNAFSNYISSYPNGRYVADSHYWLGEINLQQQHTNVALKQFVTVINAYKNSNKVAYARLKVAIIHANQGKLAQAKSELMYIKKNYANSTAAQLASIKLQQLAVTQ